jgi:hypothetical protein
MFVSCVCCAMCRLLPLRRADYPFRGALLGLCVCLMTETTTTARRRGPEFGFCVTVQRCLCVEIKKVNFVLLRTKYSSHLIQRHFFLQVEFCYTFYDETGTKERARTSSYCVYSYIRTKRDILLQCYRLVTTVDSLQEHYITRAHCLMNTLYTRFGS